MERKLLVLVVGLFLFFSVVAAGNKNVANIKNNHFPITNDSFQHLGGKNLSSEEITTQSTDFAGGSGTSDDPYQIETWEHLNNVRNGLAAYYELISDLDNSSVGYETYAGKTANNGTGWKSIGIDYYFNGVFDGQYHTISDLYIRNRSSNELGLFSHCDGGSIKNIGILNVNINVTGKEIGGLVGWNLCPVSNTYVTGTVIGSDNVGGLVGAHSVDGDITNSFADVDVTGNNEVGGLVGTVWRESVKNSYATGSVSGNDRVGGLVGRTGFYSSFSGDYYPGYIRKSYSTGFVTGNSNVGGLLGENVDGTVSDSFWDTETSGMGASAGGTGKTTSEMQNITTFNDTSTAGLSNLWDIVSLGNRVNETWKIYNGKDYPRLGYELTLGLTLSNPFDGAAYSNATQTVKLIAKNTYHNDIDTIKYYIYNETNGLVEKNENYTDEEYVVLEDGFYTINAWINDSYGQVNETNASFLVDTIFPEISFRESNPRDGAGVIDSFILNVSFYDLNLANLSYEFDGIVTNRDLTDVKPVSGLLDGLVGFWSFENESGYGPNATLFDYSGNGNNGTTNGTATWNDSRGRYGGAYEFDGDDDYVSILAATNLPDTKGTISVWAKTFTWNVSGTFLEIGGGNNKITFGTGPWENGQISVYIPGSDHVEVDNLENKEFLIPNEWHHIVGVWDTNNNSNARIYIDGVDRTNDRASVSEPSGHNKAVIGKSVDWGNYFNGTIDEVMIFNRSLSSDEIKQIYHSQIRKFPKNNSYTNNYNEEFNSSDDSAVMNLISTDTNMSEFYLTANQTGILTAESYNYSVNVWDLAGNINFTEERTIWGGRSPSFSNIVTNPTNASLGRLDPNETITVNVSVTDLDGNLDTVKLQWKNSTASEWNEKEMINVTNKNSTILNTNYTANFTPTKELNYTFRIWANDTDSLVGYSNNHSLEVFWDCTWNYSKSIKREVAGWNENKFIGNLTIENTGDSEYQNGCSIDLDLLWSVNVLESVGLESKGVYPNNTEDWWPTYYNLTPKENLTIPINISFSDFQDPVETEIEFEVKDINQVSESYKGNYSRYFNVTVITTKAGPYLVQRMTKEPPSSIYLTPQKFSLSGYVRNVMGGSVNGTAFNVSLFWRVPSKWFTEGNKTFGFSNISDKTKRYTFLNISLNKTNIQKMKPGISFVNLSVWGYTSNGSLIEQESNTTKLTTEKIVSVLCYEEKDGIYVPSCYPIDPDEPPVKEKKDTGGGSTQTTGSRGLSGAESEKILQTRETFELVRGEDQNFELIIGNPFDGNLQDININLSGFLRQYLSIDPSYIHFIKKGESKKTTIRIEAPKYFTKGKYKLNFTITGLINETKMRDNKKFTILTNLKGVKFVTLIVHEISKEKATEYLINSKNFVKKMNSSEIYINDVSILLNNLIKNFENKDYSEVKKLYTKIKTKKENSLGTLRILEDVKEKMNKSDYNGIETPDTQRLYLLSKQALKRGDFSLALERAKDARTTYGLETAGKFNAFAFMKNNWQMLSIGTALMIVLGYFASIALRFQLINRKLKSLREEENIILGLIKQIQKECFVKRKLSMEEYMDSLNQYEKKMSKIIQRIIGLETKKENLFKFFKKERTRLNEEREKLIDMIKRTQKLYLKSGEMETRIYKNRMQSYSERLAEIEEKLADVEAKRAIKEGEKNTKESVFSDLKNRLKQGELLKKENLKKGIENKVGNKMNNNKEIKIESVLNELEDVKGIGPKTIKKIKNKYKTLSDLNEGIRTDSFLKRSVKKRLNKRIKKLSEKFSNFETIKERKNKNKSGEYDYEDGGWKPKSLIRKIKEMFKVNK